MAHKFTFFTPGSQAPEYTYIFSLLAIVFLFLLSMLGISLWTGNILIAAIGSIVIAVLLYLLVRRLELIKIGNVVSDSTLSWLVLIVAILFTIGISYHYLHNYMSDTNNTSSESSASFLSKKAEEYRVTADFYGTYASVLEEMNEGCEHGFLDINESIKDAEKLETRYIQLAANVKNPLNIISTSEPLGTTFDLQKKEILDAFSQDILGDCQSPLPKLHGVKFDGEHADLGPMASLSNMNPLVFFPLLILLPIMLLLPYFMAEGRISDLKANPYHRRNK